MPIKGSTLLLGASLTVNAALVAVVAVKAPWLFHVGPAESDQGMPKSADSKSGPTISQAPAASGPAVAALLSGDLPTLGARLRSAGFPPSVIRALIQAKIDELFYARRRELFAQSKMNPYWSRNFKSLTPDTLVKFGALNKERMDMQKELLPEDPSVTPINPFQQNINGGLSPEKTKRVQAINSDYNDLKGEIYTSAKGTLLPEDIEKLNLLEKEQQTDMAETLSPNELFEYQIRNSPTSDQMRNSMQAFNPTEDEYRAIFKVQQAFDQQYGSNGNPLTPEQNAERQKHQGEVLDQLKGVLSPDRLEEYKEETDPGFLAVNQVLSRFDLPPAATKQVMDIQADITKRAEAIRQDKSITDGDRTSQLSALADEATTKATSVVGDRGFEAYRQTSGSWIQGLRPPAN